MKSKTKKGSLLYRGRRRGSASHRTHRKRTIIAAYSRNWRLRRLVISLDKIFEEIKTAGAKLKSHSK
jgi:hypothetical protein